MLAITAEPIKAKIIILAWTKFLILETATKNNNIYRTQEMALPWILGKLPKIETYWVWERNVETRTVTNNSSKGRSSGVLVIMTLPSRTQEKDQRTRRTRTATVKTINLGVSKNSVVKEVKTRGVRTATVTKIAKITLFIMADKFCRIASRPVRFDSKF